ncbi:hypothetical protein [Achromobacter piechaudii]|uniref:hypothetical protein n=1 Tax=Achromobacter piechaudii TaxID=72556 RepID=UPI003DA85B68
MQLPYQQTSQRPLGTAKQEIDAIMEQAQVFVSTRAFFSDPFEQGDGKEQAKREDARLRDVIRDALSKIHAEGGQPAAPQASEAVQLLRKVHEDGYLSDTMTCRIAVLFESSPRRSRTAAPMAHPRHRQQTEPPKQPNIGKAIATLTRRRPKPEKPNMELRIEPVFIDRPMVASITTLAESNIPGHGRHGRISRP